ncbi:hypothetical protein FOA43_002915 [Brettanomyces nanus]|uniref:Uncharacterized protein n=1 Tax=Eeniella nana TaxID=13502 RepID=A0A875RPX1_EENNA|nr:uncharacterized protein FOA43_002915 [Brettanomyces nanus]QPG75560.1 hypothetical protein FOA43_002915 [Brettanomyces nanus]
MKVNGLSETSNESGGGREPKTVNEIFDQATQEEESGDRWLSSDLSKALRFYQRAYSLYMQALNIDVSHLDTRYNASRLLFTVYTEYIKNEGVNLTDLNNCDLALSRTDASVIQPLQNICQFFQISLELVSQASSRFAWDLYYNAALCYFEYVEEETRNGYETMAQFSQVMDAMQISQRLLSSALQYQVKELKQFTEKVGKAEPIIHSEVPTARDTIAEIEDTILPSTVLETCLNCYRLVSTSYEDSWSEERLSLVANASDEFINVVDSISSGLLDNYTNSSNEIVPSLTEDEINELKITKISFLASKSLTFAECEAVWQSEPLLDLVDKLLLEAGSYRTLLDKLDESLAVVDDKLKWQVLSVMDTKYKECYKVLKKQLDQLKKRSVEDTGDDKSNIISQICSVFIEQADIEVERSMLESGQKYHDVLVKNSYNLLKNSLVYSKQGGGLRESVSGKLVREKRRRETLARLCILDGKLSRTELSSIVGANYWPQEMSDLADVSVYSEGAKSALTQA